jgi:hypothetical protein
LIRIFISYSSDDKERAQDFQRYLEELEPKIFKAILVDHEKKPIESITKKIEDELFKCQVFIPLITENSLLNRWVNQEIGYVFSLKQKLDIKIIPIVHNREDINKGFIHNQLELPFVWDKEDYYKTFEEVRNYMTKELQFPFPIHVYPPSINLRADGGNQAVKSLSPKQILHAIETEITFENINRRIVEHLRIGIVYPAKIWAHSHSAAAIKKDILPFALKSYFKGDSNLLLYEVKELKYMDQFEMVFQFYWPDIKKEEAEDIFTNGAYIEYGIYIFLESQDPRIFHAKYIVKEDKEKTVNIVYFEPAKSAVVKLYSSSF